jgi:quinol monooxygenase YgiN
MLAISVMVETHPEFTEQYREAVLRHAHNCRSKEKGCLTFRVHSHPDDPNRFFLYEAYQTKNDFHEVHCATPYMAEFRKITESWTKSKEIIIWDVASPE